MKARSVARELALLVLFQLEKKGEPLEWEKVSFEELVVNTVRTLVNMAHEQLENAMHELVEMRNLLTEVEVAHPLNEMVPVDQPTHAVPVPNTHQMQARLDALFQAVEQLEEALYVPEVSSLAEREDVKNYCLMLVRNAVTHQDQIDGVINQTAQGWRVDRLKKMDLTLLRLAIAEMRYAQVDIPMVIEEYLTLAHRFTDEEGRKFIHGVLGSVAGLSETSGATEHV